VHQPGEIYIFKKVEHVYTSWLFPVQYLCETKNLV